MTDTQLEKIARKAVQTIVLDLSDRRGLKHEWHQIEANIQLEIRAEWRKAILAALKSVRDSSASVKPKSRFYRDIRINQETGEPEDMPVEEPPSTPSVDSADTRPCDE